MASGQCDPKGHAPLLTVLSTTPRPLALCKGQALSQKVYQVVALNLGMAIGNRPRASSFKPLVQMSDQKC